MKNRLVTLITAFGLAVFVPVGFLYAQSFDQLNLRLNHTDSQSHRLPEVPQNGEFRLLFGSQLFDESENSVNESLSGSEIARIETTESFSDFGGLGIERVPGPAPDHLTLRSNRIDEQRFAPTITLSSAYEDNAIGPHDASAESLSISGSSGRFHFYGEVERQQLTNLSAPSPSRFSETGNLLRASVVSRESDSQMTLEPHEKNTALASRYYLEAIYSFKPTLKGRVSFRRSMIDTFDSEEKLQVEGIVDANRNMQIKAGYHNEVRPEVTDTKSSKDTTVWTEFILKF